MLKLAKHAQLQLCIQHTDMKIISILKSVLAYSLNIEQFIQEELVKTAHEQSKCLDSLWSHTTVDCSNFSCYILQENTSGN